MPDLLDGIAAILAALLWPTLAIVVVIALWPLVRDVARSLSLRFESDDNVEASVAGVRISLHREVQRQQHREATSLRLPDDKAAVVREVENLEPTESIRTLNELVLARIREYASESGVPIFSSSATVHDVAVALAYAGKLSRDLLGETADFDQFTQFALEVPPSRLDAATLKVFQAFAERHLAALEQTAPPTATET